MTSLRLFFLSAKHLLRLYLPNPWIRYTIVFLAGALMIGAVGIGLVFGLHPPPEWERASRSPEAAVNLSAMFFILSIAIVATPTLITVHGALKLLSHPESVSLVLLSPISPTAKFWSTIGPLVLFSSIVYFIIISPFVVMFAFLEPLVSFITILYFFLVSGWSLVLSFLSLMLLINYLGREKGLRLAYSLPFLLLLLPVLFLNVSEDFRAVAPVIGYWQLIFFSISLALLPPIFISTSRSFYKLLTTSLEPVRRTALGRLQSVGLSGAAGSKLGPVLYLIVHLLIGLRCAQIGHYYAGNGRFCSFFIRYYPAKPRHARRKKQSATLGDSPLRVQGQAGYLGEAEPSPVSYGSSYRLLRGQRTPPLGCFRIGYFSARGVNPYVAPLAKSARYSIGRVCRLIDRVLRDNHFLVASE